MVLTKTETNLLEVWFTSVKCTAQDNKNRLSVMECFKVIKLVM